VLSLCSREYRRQLHYIKDELYVKHATTIPTKKKTQRICLNCDVKFGKNTEGGVDKGGFFGVISPGEFAKQEGWKRGKLVGDGAKPQGRIVLKGVYREGHRDDVLDGAGSEETWLQFLCDPCQEKLCHCFFCVRDGYQV
jgi:hypothetical protein